MDNFANLPMKQNMDGKDYFFKSFALDAQTDTDILAEALVELGDVTHVRLTTTFVLQVQVNGIPADVTEGKTVPSAVGIGLTHGLIGAWEVRMPVTSLHVYANGQATVEVEYWNTHGK